MVKLKRGVYFPLGIQYPLNSQGWLYVVDVIVYVLSEILRDKKMVDKLKFIPNDDEKDYPSVD